LRINPGLYSLATSNEKVLRQWYSVQHTTIFQTPSLLLRITDTGPLLQRE